MFSIEAGDALGIALTSALAIGIVLFFILRDEGKPIWKFPGMANLVASCGIALFVGIVVFVLLPLKRHEPHVVQMIRLVAAAGFGAMGWQHWRGARVLKADIFARRGTVGWQLWRASPTMSTGGELIAGILLRISAFVLWAGVLETLWTVAAPP